MNIETLDMETQEYINQLKRRIADQRDTIEELSEQLKAEQEIRQSAEFRIKTELEPRINQEKAQYDYFVASGGTGAEAGEAFKDKVDELIDLVEENPEHFEWDYSRGGDVYAMVLHLVNAHINDGLKDLCIEDIEDKPEQEKPKKNAMVER